MKITVAGHLVGVAWIILGIIVSVGGMVYLFRGSSEEATTINVSTDDPEYVKDKINTLQRLGESGGGTVDSYMVLAQFYTLDGDNAAAVAAYEEAKLADPRTMEFYSEEGYQELLKGIDSYIDELSENE